MTSTASDDADYQPGVDESLHDSTGNLIDDDYIDQVSREAEIGYDVEDLEPARVGRPSLSDAGDSPQVRFRLPAATRAEASDVAAREGKTLSQLARDAVEAYLEARRSA
ncbi:MAG: hypothetical protein H0V92_13675 [Pseudonocardiales bacterium]|nr:hypothetical protein [Pseudonocardiales bacterium]